MRKVGVYFHPELDATRQFASELCNGIERAGAAAWSCSAWDADGVEQLSDSDLIISIGGDGTVLRAARVVAPKGVPLLGVNMGRLGFLTELTPEEMRAGLAEIVGGAGRIEERSLLEVRIRKSGGSALSDSTLAMNDAVVGRRSVGRPVYVDVAVDDQHFTTYQADAVLVATATGSTGYNLSAQGPILHPESRELIVTPVAPHLSLARSVVLPADACVDLLVRSNHATALSVDGQEDTDLSDSDVVRIRRSVFSARFLRLSPPQHFYAVVGQRLASITDSSELRGTARGDISRGRPHAP